MPHMLICLLLALSADSQSTTMGKRLSTEQSYLHFFRHVLPDWWHTHASEKTWQTHDNIKLAYVSILQPTPSPTVIFVNGRTESYLKYKEVAFDFFQKGYSIFLFDNRGQGLSQRLLPDAEIGYVERFDDYVDDLDEFQQKIVAPASKAPTYLIGHSMGGLITLLYLERQPKNIVKAAVTAPMIGIHFK